jgi:hypothetical protein
MESDQNPLTLDDFYERLVKPLADKGSVPHMLMMEAWELTKKGGMTPNLNDTIREYVRKILP